ncbi:MAG: hypothetical protein DI635_12465 [Pseudoxanthomonas suwonensis]|nr:MAG: hypothetical protein DI635_12465 [Pseudoxanthomonas suwonensis]
MTLHLVPLLDLAGTFAFAISGATEGARRRLDLFGVLVLSFVAATAGGIARDVLLGATPPLAFSDWRYGAASLLAGMLVFYQGRVVERLRNPVQLFDAAGLGLFAVIGAEKALHYGAGPLAALLLGMLAGIGGGMARDILVAKVPSVLQRELYAVAALLASAIVVAGTWLALPMPLLMTVGAAACFGLRFLAIRRGWQLPVAGGDSSAGHA